MNPAVALAIGVLADTAKQLARARAANALINGLGHGNDTGVVEIRRLIQVQWDIAADTFEADIEAELAERSSDHQGAE